MKRIEIAIGAALEAGESIMEIYHSDNFEVDFKHDNTPLTKADIKAHRIITQGLQKTGIPVLSEEGRDIPFAERSSWAELWIVDPIDGTKEFIKKNGEFTVNIALVEHGVPVLGVVYAPALGELFYASRESGSFFTEVVSGDSVPLLMESGQKLPSLQDNRKYTVVASRSHMSPETEQFIADLKIKHGDVELISRGSSLKLCMVAQGLADCYPRFAPTMEWDTAAGQAICMYAGYDVIDWKTKETMRYNRENLLNNWFLVTAKTNEFTA